MWDGWKPASADQLAGGKQQLGTIFPCSDDIGAKLERWGTQSAKKTSSTHQQRWFSARVFWVVFLNSDPIWKSRQRSWLASRCFSFFLKLVIQFLARMCKIKPDFPARSWRERHPVCSSAAAAAAANLLQGFRRAVQRSASNLPPRCTWINPVAEKLRPAF